MTSAPDTKPIPLVFAAARYTLKQTLHVAADAAN
jgi:hypothetical protein